MRAQIQFILNVLRELTNISAIAGVVACAMLVPQSAYAEQTLIVSISKSGDTNGKIYEGRVLGFDASVKNLASHDAGTTSSLRYSWNFGDGTGSMIPDPVKSYNVDQDSTKTVTLNVYQDIESTTGTAQVASGSSSLNIKVLDTPTTTTRRSISDIPGLSESSVEGVDYKIIYVTNLGANKLKYILDTQVNNDATTQTILVYMDKGVDIALFESDSIVTRANVYIIGNTRLRGDISGENYIPYDPNGTLETTVHQGIISLRAPNTGVYDILISKTPASASPVRIALNANNEVIEGVVFSNLPASRLVFTETGVTTATIKNCRFDLASGQTAVFVGGLDNHDPKNIELNNNAAYVQGGGVGTFVETNQPVTVIGLKGNITTIQKVRDTIINVTLPTKALDIADKNDPNSIATGLSTFSSGVGLAAGDETSIVQDKYGRTFVRKNGVGGVVEWNITGYKAAPISPSAVKSWRYHK